MGAAESSLVVDRLITHLPDETSPVRSYFGWGASRRQSPLSQDLHGVELQGWVDCAGTIQMSQMEKTSQAMLKLASLQFYSLVFAHIFFCRQVLQASESRLDSEPTHSLCGRVKRKNLSCTTKPKATAQKIPETYLF